MEQKLKIITIGDIHGLTVWNKLRHEDYNYLVFLGDYVDSFSVDDQVMLDNFKEIISFKTSFPEKVILLLGNHENSYLFPGYRATGYRYGIAEKIFVLLRENAELFQVSWQYKNYLWTHAGIHTDYSRDKLFPQIADENELLSATLERLFKEEYSPLFEVGYERGGWSEKMTGGPFWIDKTRLIENPLRGYHQIVGHNPVITIEHYVPDEADNDTSVTFCDCIEHGDGSFYVLEIQ